MRSDYRSEYRSCERTPRAPRVANISSWRARPLAAGRNHGHVHGSAAELPGRGAVRDVDVQTAFAYGGPGIEDPVGSVVRRCSRNSNARSKRQYCGIGCDDTLRDGDAGCGNGTGAIRSRGKQYWCRGSCWSLRCRWRHRHLCRRCLRRRHLRRRCRGRRGGVNPMSTRGNG
jgi:hypothetical protein